MTTKRHTVYSAECDLCEFTYGEDFVPYFDSPEAAETEVLGYGWRKTGTGLVCASDDHKAITA